MQLEAKHQAAETGSDAASRSMAALQPAWYAENVLFWGVLAIVATMPLLFGGGRPWVSSLFAILVGLLLFGYALCLVFVGARLSVPLRRLKLPLLLIALPVLWVFLQMTPIGQSVLAHPIWFSTGEVLQRPIPGRISVDPFATGTALMRLFLYIGVFFLAVQLCRRSERCFLALEAIAVIGAIYAILGIIASTVAPEQLSWAPRASQREDLSAIFFGRGPYAAFAGLGLLAALALVAKLVHRPAVASVGPPTTFRRLMYLVLGKGWTGAVAMIVLIPALLLVGPSSGFVAAALGVIALLLCLITATRLNSRRRSVAVALIVVGVLLLPLLLLGELRNGGPWPASAELQDRAVLHELVIQGIATAPLLGHGHGAFETAFQGYNDARIDGHVVNAHGDFLELAFELGVPAAMLLVLTIATVTIRCLLGVYRRRRDIVYPALAVAATILAGAHALIDFSLQAPAVATLLAYILGLGYSQSWSSSEL